MENKKLLLQLIEDPIKAEYNLLKKLNYLKRYWNLIQDKATFLKPDKNKANRFQRWVISYNKIYGGVSPLFLYAGFLHGRTLKQRYEYGLTFKLFVFYKLSGERKRNFVKIICIDDLITTGYKKGDDYIIMKTYFDVRGERVAEIDVTTLIKGRNDSNKHKVDLLL